jgi:hypothetical protein
VAAVEAELERSDAAAAYEDAAGWNPPVLGDRSVQVGMALHRLVVAFRLCRERQHAGTRTARPDLDRLWTHFFLACGVLGGLLLSELTGFSWLAHLAPNRTVFGLVYVGALVLCVATGHRVVGRELRAAAEAAVRQGRRPVRRVT